MIKPNITKRAEIEARKEAQEQAQVRRDERNARIKELRDNRQRGIPEMNELLDLLLEERGSGDVDQ